MMQLFIQFELQKFIKFFATRTLAKIITTTLFLVVFFLVSSGIYYFFLSGFRFINIEADEDIRMALTLFLYEVFLIILSGVTVFSAMVSGVFSLFKGDRNNWIISSPSYLFFPRMILMRSIMTSMLPSLILFIPAVLAFIRVHNTTPFSLFFIVVSAILILILLNSLTLLFILYVAKLYKKISSLSKIPFLFGGLISILIATTISSSIIIWKIIKDVDLVKLFKAEEGTEAALTVSTISNHFYFLPTHPFALEILNWQQGETGQALLTFGVVALLTLMVTYIWWYGSSSFFKLWKTFQEGNTQRKEGSLSIFSRSTYYFTGSNTLALFKKEALIATRNFKGLLWFLFLISIWLAQVGTHVIVGKNLERYQIGIDDKFITLQLLQFIIAVYFIAAFSLRFVFPSFSMEKKTSWVVRSAPVSFSKLFFGKYSFYTVFFVSLGLLMSSISSSILHVTITQALYSTMLLIVTILFIITLALSFGALFPSNDSDDPEIISTSMPGLSFTALALIFGAISDSVLRYLLVKNTTVYLFPYIIIVAIITLIVLVLTPRFVRNQN